jgi:hypothetical protein
MIVKFICGFTLMNMARRLKSNALAFAVCFCMVALLAVYFGNMAIGQKRLAELSSALPVTARVSNLNGTLLDGLQIKGERVRKMRYLDNVRDFACTVGMMADLADAAQGGAGLHGVSAVGVNDIRALPSLAPGAISMEGGAGLGFLGSDGALCVAGEGFLERAGLAPGDTVALSLYRADYTNGPFMLQYLPLCDAELEIAGTYGAEEFDGAAPPDIIFPFDWAESVYAAAGAPFYADSVAFRVVDPLRLNEFKAQAKEAGFMHAISGAAYDVDGIALLINDATFIHSAESVNKNMLMLEGFLPAIFALAVSAACLVSFAMLQGRRREYAIMRSLGTGAKACAGASLLEAAALAIAGCLAGAAASLAGGADAGGVAVAAAATMACYVCGTAAPVLLRGRLSVIAVLAGGE